MEINQTSTVMGSMYKGGNNLIALEYPVGSRGDFYESFGNDNVFDKPGKSTRTLAAGLTFGLAPALSAAATAINPITGAAVTGLSITGCFSLPGMVLYMAAGGNDVHGYEIPLAGVKTILPSIAAAVASHSGHPLIGMTIAGAYGIYKALEYLNNEETIGLDR